MPNIVVITTTEMTGKNYVERPYNEIYDVRFTDEIQVQRIIEWYKDIWKKTADND